MNHVPSIRTSGVRDEPDFLRIFLQFSVRIYHVQTGQLRPAVERIEEGLLLVGSNRDDHGIDLLALASGMRVGVRNLRHKIEPDPTHPMYIINVPGVGYKFQHRIGIGRLM